MGIWKEIKYALNSTLGTKDFAPLDVLIAQQYKMVVSDELYETFEDFRFEVEPEGSLTLTYPQKLVMTRYGELKLTGNLYRGSAAYVTAEFSVVKNGEVIFSFKKNRNSGENNEAFSSIIPFEPNDTIVISVSGHNTTIREHNVGVSDMKIYGTLKETAFIKQNAEG